MFSHRTWNIIIAGMIVIALGSMVWLSIEDYQYKKAHWYYENEFPDDFFRDYAMEWALGEDYDIMLTSNFDDVWNERHGDLFELKGFDDLQASILQMRMAYAEHGKKPPGPLKLETKVIGKLPVITYGGPEDE